jgi:hypothetical protein
MTKLGLVLWVILSCRLAYADTEGWLIVDSRLPVYSSADDQHKLSLRVMTDFRVAARAHGLQQALMRGGFAWEPRPWLLLGSQTNANVQTSDGQKFIREWRQELEATVAMPMLPLLSFAHRQRLELRITDGNVSPRHRILLRLNLTLRSQVQPYVWDEVMVTPLPYWLNQNRFSVGVAWRPRKNFLLELGYLWRLRNVGAAGLVSDHAPRLAITFIPSSVEELGPYITSE